MTKYNSLSRKSSAPVSTGPHPIWNGIGCLMMIIVPIISFALAYITMDYALDKKWPIPPQFLGYASLPDFLYNSRILVPMLNAVTGVENLNGYIAITFVYIVVLGGILSFAYAVVYRLVGPARYGPMDLPPVKARTKHYKR